jgi:hypothetical protein
MPLIRSVTSFEATKERGWLASRNGRGRMPYEPASYLAAGCRLGDVLLRVDGCTV